VFSVMVNNSVRLKPLKLCTMMLVSCIRCGTFVLVFVAVSVTLLRGTGDAVCVNCCVCVFLDCHQLQFIITPAAVLCK